MRTARKSEYKSVLVELHHVQVEELDRLRQGTGAKRVELIREAIALYLGRSALVEKGASDVKVA